MGRNNVRVAALAMASVLMLGSVGLFSGCKRKNADDGVHVSEDALWYDTVKLDLESPYDDVELLYGMMHEPVYIEDSLYILVTGEKRFDEKLAMKDPNYNYDQNIINSLLKYDMHGKFIEEFNLDGIEGLSNFKIKSVSEYKGNIRLNAIATDTRSMMTSYYSVAIDPKTGEVAECVTCNLGDTVNTDLVDSIVIGDYEVVFMYVYGATENNYELVIKRGAEIINKVDVAKKTGIHFWDINQYFAMDDDTVVMTCYCEEGKMTGTLKVSTGEFSIAANTMQNLGSFRFMTEQNGKAMAVDSEGIWKINSGLEVESVISLSDTYINANYVSTGSVAYYDDNMAILFAYNQDYSITLPEYTVYIITKADKNPNVGKTILDVYVMSDKLSYSEAEAIVQFNSSNPDYFARVSFADLNYTGYEDAEKKNEMINNVANKLVTDIMSGNSPDVILDGASVKQLNNPDFLTDLNGYVNGNAGIDKSKYFSNIIDNAKSPDGSLYQLSVTYSIGGIMAYKSDAGEGKIGFTVDEYNQFVKQICNGKNPVELSKIDFFVDCIARGYVDYMADGKVDFNTPEFKALAEYANRYVFDPVETDKDATSDYVVIGGMNPIKDGPIYATIKKPEDIVYQSNDIHKPFGMYGYPGMTGKDGPTAYVTSSAAISAVISDEMKAASWEFIKMMLSEDVQKKEQDGNPVNISAYTYKTQRAVDVMNASYDSYVKNGMGEAELAQYYLYRLDDSVVEYVVDIAKSVTSVNSIDTSVEKIIYEEMGAYFAGQKDIDTIVRIINNRVQTVVNERGTA